MGIAVKVVFPVIVTNVPGMRLGGYGGHPVPPKKYCIQRNVPFIAIVKGKSMGVLLE